MNKKIFNLLISFCLSLFIFISDSNAKDADGLFNELINLAERGHEINFDDESKRFGFKNFSEAVKDYKKEFNVKLSVKEAKSFFIDMLPDEEIKFTKENADKLFKIIINSKYKSAKRYKGKYLTWNAPYPYKAFAITMNIEREFSRITKDPNIKSIAQHTWTWWSNNSREGVIKVIMYECKKDIIKYKIPFQECIIIDINEKNVLYEFLPKIRTAAVEEKRIAEKKKMEEEIRILQEERKKAEEKAGTKIAKTKAEEKKLAKQKEEKKLAKPKEEKKLAKQKEEEEKQLKEEKEKQLKEEKKLARQKEEKEKQLIIETIVGEKVLDDDYVVLINLSAKAPHALYDLQGNIVFDDKIATTCVLNRFVKSTEIDLTQLIYIRYQIDKTVELKTLDFKGECIESEYLSNDLIIFQTKNLKKEKKDYLQKIATQITKKNIKTFSVILDADYQAAKKKRKSIIYQIKQDIKNGNIIGYGTLVLTNNSSQFCLSVPKEQKKHLFLIDSLDEEFILMGVQKPISAIFYGNTDEIFAKSQKEKCGFIYANEIDLKQLLNGLTTAKIGYSLASKWFSEDDLKFAEQLEEQELLSEQLKKEVLEKKTTEELERQKSSGELLANYTKELRAKHQNVVQGHKNYLNEEFSLFFFNDKASDFWKFFYPEVISHFKDKKNKGWEAHKYTFEINNFGTTTYKGRELPGFIMNLYAEIKNNKLGEYEENCVVLAILKDKEFSYYRNPGLFKCGHDAEIKKWQKVNKFKTQWNPSVDDIK